MSFSRFLAVLALSACASAQTASQPQTAPPAGSQKQNSAAEKERSGYDPVLDLPPLPDKKLTLLGGTVTRVDPINERLSIKQFGGGNMNVLFDLRTKILQNGHPASTNDIQPGSRVYIDTMLNGDKVFAKSIRIETGANQGDARGQVVSIDTNRGILSIREEVAPQPFQLRLTPQTKVMMGERSISASEVRPGALVVVNFSAGGDKGIAREIHVLANPGTEFTFAGKIAFVDLRLRRMAVSNTTDSETYDIALDRVSNAELRGLKVGSDVVIKAVFDGKNYQAQSVEIAAPRPNSSEAEKQ